MTRPHESDEIETEAAGADPSSFDLDAFGKLARGILRSPGEAPPAAGRIDKFPILEELGAGTFGRVYRVHDPDLRCDRAAKVPTELVLGSPLLRLEFLREARNLQRIDDHPNVVRVVQAGEDDGAGRPYFVMEYCRDRSLASWLQGRPKGWRADEKWAARLMAQVADGVHRLHQERLCHRDLKPGNILLARVGEGGDGDLPDFRPKIADLGLASFLDDPEASASLREGPVGTVAYMAPEQVRGSRKEIGRPSDVYGLGGVLFEMVAGRRAYASASRGEIFELLQSTLPSPSLREACQRPSRAMCTVVDTAMRKEPGHRYASAAEMADDLKRLADGRPVRGATRARKAFFFLSRHRSKLAGATLAGLTVALAAEGGRIVEERRAMAASEWIGRMETALPADAAEVVRERSPRDPLVAPRLAAMFEAEEPTRKLNAALALATVRPECAAYAVDRLLTLPPKDVAPIARLVASTVPDLSRLLASEASRRRPEAAGEEPLAAARRRANAAVAMALLGEPRAGAEILADLDDPSARSLLVHSLGPASVPPAAIVGLAADPSTPPAARRQLLLALGEVPDPSWTEADRWTAAELARSLYRDDPDPGVHGASKWLLKRSGFAAWIAGVDRELASRDYRPGFSWRVDPSGLTFVAIFDEATGHRFEITDTEVPWRLYRTFDPDFPGPGYGHVLADDEPVLGVGFLDAAAFANAFGAGSGAPPTFALGLDAHTVPLASEVVATRGYRPPTTGEYLLAARAGTSTPCYFGDVDELIPYYAFTADTLGRPSVQAVGRLKPNDLGLFDAIGNGLEQCHFDGPLEEPFGRQNQVSLCGMSGIQSPIGLTCEPMHPPGPATPPMIPSGFRLARTLVDDATP
ncbi:bifunctional serine/threonine-protein kinase/formylglycine-generating enzyme family protein [Paludisphaera soli]|uniref:bifunctional serine/threonine-protein kinase/formylglycine-generating enzyme family protein n=1 Tax=Paludisphaera soli TaxID=2712865 RepID=UPI0013ED80C3|nr:bifunctional serine/threonine-protein kinase/formylglycine-generating enzyme family protein [Paludisphaera soli]